MSRLIDLIDKAGLQPMPPMGFGAASGREEVSPQMVMIGRQSPNQIIGPNTMDSSADALLITDLFSFEDLPETPAEIIWGVQSANFTVERVKELTERSCDFVVFESLDTHAALVNERDLGVLVSVGDDMLEETLRSLAELPIDGLIYGPELREFPLTIGTLLAIQRIRGVTDKPLLVETPQGLGPTDLESLRAIGVNALILDLESGKSGDVREAIDGLPRRKESPKHRDALVPQSTLVGPTHNPEEDEDEDEDEDF